jgi:diaminopimelate epimerase
MQLTFTKMSGAGNDFIVADNRDGHFPTQKDALARLCDRHFGVGADGILLVEPSKTADFFMRYYNADGGEAEMCGNGARCIARFAHKIGAAPAKMTFETRAGLIRAEIGSGDLVRLSMTDPKNLALGRKIRLREGEFDVHNVNTGVPHAVIFVEKMEETDVQNLGAQIRFHADYKPAGTNANFVQVLGPDSIRVRTYERGVEAETLACGTGVVAAAIIAHLAQKTAVPMSVRVQSGRVLEVNFAERNGEIRDVTLAGPAEFVFEGRWLL